MDTSATIKVLATSVNISPITGKRAKIETPVINPITGARTILASIPTGDTTPANPTITGIVNTNALTGVNTKLYKEDVNRVASKPVVASTDS